MCSLNQKFVVEQKHYFDASEYYLYYYLKLVIFARLTSGSDHTNIPRQQEFKWHQLIIIDKLVAYNNDLLIITLVQALP